MKLRKEKRKKVAPDSRLISSPEAAYTQEMSMYTSTFNRELT